MSIVALSFTLIFVMITMLASVWQKVGLEKEIAIGTIRSAVQLLLVGYILQYVFNTKNPLLLLFIISIMILVASYNASKRAKGITGIVWRIYVSIALTELLMMALVLGLGIVEVSPRFIIPISGMTIGNAMVVAGLFLNRMKEEVHSSRPEIETLLALGATAKQAVHLQLKKAVKSSMIPTIDSMKTVGIVQLPGMMTGMIIAGADPVEAVKYQILIVFAFTSSAAITAITLSLLSYKSWFTADIRVKEI